MSLHSSIHFKPKLTFISLHQNLSNFIAELFKFEKVISRLNTLTAGGGGGLKVEM